MKIFKHIISALAILLSVVFIIFIIFVIFCGVSEQKIITEYTKNLPHNILEENIAESINTEQYGHLLYNNNYGRREWAIKAPTKKLKEKDLYWIIQNNPNILYHLQYDLWNSEIENEILIHKNFEFPNLIEDDISEIVFIQHMDSIQYTCSPLKWDSDRQEYILRNSSTIHPNFSKEECDLLRSLAFTTYEQTYHLELTVNIIYGQVWDAINSPIHDYGNYIESESSLLETYEIWDIHWYYEGCEDICYNRYYLVKDSNNNYYFSLNEIPDYTIKLPKEISEKIHLAFSQKNAE